jgi:ligand-binding sensor domain-containing protein
MFDRKSSSCINLLKCPSGFVPFKKPKLTARMVCWVLLISAMVWNPVLVQSREIRFDRIQADKGLSQSSILCILQDSHGFMWFGTHDGLNHYDGYTFKVYKPEPQNPNSLSSSDVMSVYEDRSKALWVGTAGGGLNRFDPETEQFVHYRHDPRNPGSLSDDNVYAVFEDRTGVLWAGTYGAGSTSWTERLADSRVTGTTLAMTAT